jgi:hypothetical protein
MPVADMGLGFSFGSVSTEDYQREPICKGTTSAGGRQPLIAR